MGVVYRARDSKLKRDVALKVLANEFATDHHRLARFQREAEVLAALNHPNIAQIYGIEGTALVMELVEGHPLSDAITPGGMPVTRFLDLALPLAEALTAAHQKQVTHRDLKPGNIMVGVDGRVKVLDFGLARVGGDPVVGQQTLIVTQAPMTEDGTIVGTMPYMSPEQVEGRPVDTRSDLFSLGVIFYEMLSGERPFKADSSPSLMSAILRDTPAAIVSQQAAVPAALERLVFRLLEKRPDDRVQTARDVFNELRHLRKQTESQSEHQPLPSPARPGVTSAKPPSSQHDLLSIAIAPLTARSADDESRALADGLTDDIPVLLSKFGHVRVSGPSAGGSSRFLLEGQVRRSGRTVRISATLIDTRDSTHLWSDHVDRELAADMFALQDEVAGRIVATLGDQTGVLTRAIAEAAADTPYEQRSILELVAGYCVFTEHFRADEHARLRDALDQAVTREPLKRGPPFPTCTQPKRRTS